MRNDYDNLTTIILDLMCRQVLAYVQLADVIKLTHEMLLYFVYNKR